MAPTVLQLLHWGTEPEGFGWYEAPEPAAVKRARALLMTLGAVDQTGITPLGRRLADSGSATSARIGVAEAPVANRAAPGRPRKRHQCAQWGRRGQG